MALVLAVAVMGAACAGGQDGEPAEQGAPAAEDDAASTVEQDVVAVEDQDILSEELLEEVTGIMNDRATQTGRAFIEGVVDARDLDTVALTMGDGRLREHLHSAYFTPAIVVGSPGQELTLQVTNAGGRSHTFTIDEQDIDSWVLAGDEGKGQTIEAKVTFPEDGSGPVIFYCKPHDAGGMLGTLVSVA